MSMSCRVKDYTAAQPAQAYRRAGYAAELKCAGSNLVGLCPFHNDVIPSFNIRLRGEWAGRYKCFGCEARGDIVDFFQRVHGVDFRQAVEGLGSTLGLSKSTPHKSAPSVASATSERLNVELPPIPGKRRQ